MLTTPERHLAHLRWLLTSPSLLAPGAVPAGILDGDARLGESWWQQLPQAAVAAALAHYRPDQPFRMGRYAEALMAAALAHLPGHRLIAQQMPVREGTASLGEIDFLLQPPAGPVLHIELAVKIYIVLQNAAGPCYVGPGLRDALDLKLDKLFRHQLQLTTHAAARPPELGDGACQPMSWLRGWMFYRTPGEPASPWLAADHLRGWWRCWGEDLPAQRPDSRWRSLPRADWMAPGTVRPEYLLFADWQATLATHFAATDRPLMVAEYAPPDAGGEELARGMVLPPGWPDPAMLAALRARLPA